jgi:hypothetical protein
MCTHNQTIEKSK